MLRTWQRPEELSSPFTGRSFTCIFQGGNSAALCVHKAWFLQFWSFFGGVTFISRLSICLGFHWFSLGQTLFLKIMIYPAESRIFYFLCSEYPPLFHLEFVSAFTAKSWAFVFLPLILCHVNFHKAESLDFFSLEQILGIWNLVWGYS